MSNKLATLSLAGVFSLIAVNPSVADEINWSNKTITSSITYNIPGGYYNPTIFTKATLNAGVIVTFKNPSWINEADFSGMLLNTGSQFLIEGGSISDPSVSFAGTRLVGNGTLFKFSNLSFNAANFTDFNVGQGSSLVFADSGFSQKATFDRAIISGTLSFTRGNMNVDGSLAKGASFKNAQFGANSTFTVSSAGNWLYTDFTEASFAGRTILEGSDFTNSIFTDAKFLATSYSTLQGNYINAVFDRATFAGRIESTEANYEGASFKNAVFSGSTSISGTMVGSNFTGAQFLNGATLTLSGDMQNMIFDQVTFGGTFNATDTNFSGSSFKSATFTGNTTLHGNISGADFTKAIFDTGSETRLTIIELTNVAMNEITIKNGALLYLDGPGTGFKFVGSTVEQGGNFTLSSDGWRRNYSNSKFNGSIFAGTSVFGVTNVDDIYNNVNLTGADFTDAQFSGTTDFRYAILDSAIFANAKLTGSVTFSGVGTHDDDGLLNGRLNDADFTGATLSGTVNFTSVDLQRAIFENAQLTGTVTFSGLKNGNAFTTGNLNSINFTGANLGSGVTFDTVNLTSANFSSTTITGSVFNNSKLDSAVFSNAKISGNTTFTGGTMNGTNFALASLETGSTTTMTSVDLSGALFNQFTIKTGATLNIDSFGNGFQFSNSTLESGANLTISSNGAQRNLTNAKFNNSIFVGNVRFGAENQSAAYFVNMSGADFTGAKFTGTANFTYSNFENSKFTNAQFTGTANFFGSRDGNNQFVSGRYYASSFNGAFLGSGVTFNTVDLSATTYDQTTIDGATFFSATLSNANFSNSTIKGNTIFDSWSWLAGVKFSGATFESANGSTVTFRDAVFYDSWNGSAAFTNSIFNGNILFERGDLTGVTFTGTQFNAGSETKFIAANLSGTQINGITIKNGALIYIDSYGDGFQFANSTVESGATLNINSDSGARNLTNAKFNNSLFAGTVLFGSQTASSGYLNLSGADFTEAQFTGTVNFRNANLESSVFTNAQLTGTVSFVGSQNGSNQFLTGKMGGSDFSGAYLGQNVTFNRVDLSSAIFNGATIEGISYTNVKLDNARFGTTTFKGGTTFSGGTMNGTNFAGSIFDAGSTTRLLSVDVSGALINGVTVRAGASLYLDSSGSGFQFANSTVESGAAFTLSSDSGQRSLTNAKFNNSVFAGTAVFGVTDGSTTNYLNLASADFTGAKFTGTANFNNANMESAVFENAELSGTVKFNGSGTMVGDQLAGGRLDDIKFKGTIFSGNVDFTGVNLQRASFENAQLTGTVNFTGSRDQNYQFITGKMSQTSFTGAYLGSGVTFNTVDMSETTYSGATIDGAAFTSATLSRADFSGATIKGNTIFDAWTWLAGASFSGATFDSENGSIITFRDAVFLDDWNGSATFANAIFNGSVLFENGEYNGVSFAGAQFNAGSNLVFNNVAMGNAPMIFGATPKYAGNLTFRNLSARGIDFSNAVFEGTSSTTFDNTDIRDAVFDGATLKNGAKLNVKGTIDNMSFEGATFEANTEISFYDTLFASSNYLNFKNASFGGVTSFSNGDRHTDLSGSDFSQAEFKWDPSKGTMFFLQNTGYTISQFKTTKNYSVVNGREHYDFRGMDISGNTTFSGQDFRGSQINSAKFGGLWANDFRDSTYGSGKPVSYGESYIDTEGRLGGLNKHSASGYNQDFLIRARLADSNLGGVYLMNDSTTVNSGISLIIGANNDIFAQGGHSGLDVYGKITMDSSSTLHLRDGSILEFFSGSQLEITIQEGQNFILIADFDDSSFVEGLDLLVFNVLGDPDHDWKLEFFDFSEESLYRATTERKLLLYYGTIPEPATATLGLIGLLALAARRKRK